MKNSTRIFIFSGVTYLLSFMLLRSWEEDLPFVAGTIFLIIATVMLIDGFRNLEKEKKSKL